MNMITKPSLWPSLGYQDADAAVRFLADAFGFDEVTRHPGPEPGLINQAVLRWQDDTIITIHTAEPGTVGFADLGHRSPIGIYLYTKDPDRLYERAVAAGARPVSGPEDSPHGTRDATVTDPEGFPWSFGTYQGD